MRAIFGVLSLMIVLLVVGVLVKKQSVVSPVSPVAKPQAQSEQIQQQVRQSLESAMQQARPMPDDQ